MTNPENPTSNQEPEAFYVVPAIMEFFMNLPSEEEPALVDPAEKPSESASSDWPTPYQEELYAEIIQFIEANPDITEFPPEIVQKIFLAGM